ncbi:sugar nucleotide-binding protein [Ornithinimicrobium sp. Y1847]|uniref:sugar nucleotide-binding protein n=1 Tax=Ornithinimicrobium sp. Y1847 TaxID=3405419 RepID=UPI003B66E99F
MRGTAIPGLLVVDLVVHGDERGWFKENWQRAKMVVAGLPDFGPVQQSISYNAAAGVTRGIHAEPWDKLVSVGHGRVFCAWVDLREGPGFGAVHTEVLDEGRAVFVPRGVANSYQALEEDVVYSYLVNDHWSPEASYTMLNLADETVAIEWPIPLSQAQISAKDEHHPRLGQVVPVAAPEMVVLGAGGQLGQALAAQFPGARLVGRDEVDLADPAAVADLDLGGAQVVINAAAHTGVDAAESPEGRRAAWAANATGVAALARRAAREGFTLVHYSSDYVFDGTAEAYCEDDAVAPLGVYGQAKAAGDLAASVAPRHYLLRTSWVIGQGGNFVRTMASLADRGISPRVVDDQVGRLTFTDDLARATAHLLTARAPYGTYNLTCSGEPASWADLAKVVFAHRGRDADDVTPVCTQDYLSGMPSDQPISPRPARSVLALDKIEATGYSPTDQITGLTAYLEGLEPAAPADTAPPRTRPDDPQNS